MIENFKGKRNTNGLKENPENINKEGRKPSIRKRLKELLTDADGKGFEVLKADILETLPNGNIIISLPTQTQLAIKLLDIAMSKKSNDSLKAIQMIVEQIDGKPKQEIEQKNIDPLKFEIIKTPIFNINNLDD